MARTIDHEAYYGMVNSFEAIVVLKEFHDVGVDVNKHAAHFNLHQGYSYGYGHEENLGLLTLAPHLFEDSHYFAAYDSIEEEDEKTAFIKKFFRNCEYEDDDMFPSYEDYSEYGIIHYKADFSKVTDLNFLQKSAYPLSFKYDLPELGPIYKDKPPSIVNHFYVEDMPCYFYVNKDRTEFLLAYDVDTFSYRMYGIVSLLCTLKRITKGEF